MVAFVGEKAPEIDQNFALTSPSTDINNQRTYTLNRINYIIAEYNNVAVTQTFQLTGGTDTKNPEAYDSANNNYLIHA